MCHIGNTNNNDKKVKIKSTEPYRVFCKYKMKFKKVEFFNNFNALKFR